MPGLIPFVLKGRQLLPDEGEPEPGDRYDPKSQVWVNRDGVPLVIVASEQAASQFGETSITETREGVDQAELTSLRASQFGETTLTKTSEGHDQREMSLASQFGETQMTATREGLDATELASSNPRAIDPYV